MANINPQSVIIVFLLFAIVILKFEITMLQTSSNTQHDLLMLVSESSRMDGNLTIINSKHILEIAKILETIK